MTCVAALLVEVKGLRAAMEQMASAGPRVQLFASRLQLQETRINNMVRRLDTVRDRMAEAQRDVARLQTEEGQLEAAIAEQKTSAAPRRPRGNEHGDPADGRREKQVSVGQSHRRIVRPRKKRSSWRI